ncbi:hypothetical protein Gogos_019442 [Gossypium gossypioides]|uniref:DUF4283 domain-containing protein n=1 Tax=Gossypium gossypioides TaxID=34282 RepID=A0A7J9BHD9_GOSGO|nr:hypothetical protein [Gossypium gossypioides]
MEEELANLYIIDGEEEPFQIQGEVHDLPLGLMSESMAWKFGIFLETFLDYDAKMVVSEMKRFTRIKARLDVWLLLKHKKKIALEHEESFWPVRVTVEPSKITFGWDISLKALWRIAPLIASQWLREPGVSTSQSLDKERREIMRLTIWEPAINTVGPNDTRLMELGSDVEDSPFSFFDNKNKQRTIGEIPIASANVDSV